MNKRMIMVVPVFCLCLGAAWAGGNKEEGAQPAPQTQQQAAPAQEQAAPAPVQEQAAPQPVAPPPPPPSPFFTGEEAGG